METARQEATAGSTPKSSQLQATNTTVFQIDSHSYSLADKLFSVVFIPPPPSLRLKVLRKIIKKNHSARGKSFCLPPCQPALGSGEESGPSEAPGTPPVPPDRHSVIKPDSLSFFSETLGVSFAHSCRLHIRSTSDGSIRQA